ncbi:RNA-binding domain-containing protein [Hypoxylon sp. FL0890]|nr:RNA-binding domain-containing protein [Hypoxylon sp. FL0890]
MHSLRRAAVRAACSSTVVAVPRQQIASLAMQVSKANAQPAMMLSLCRYFSQTSRMAWDEKAAVEEAIGSAERTGSTADTPLESSPTEAERMAMGHSIFVSNMTFDATEMHLREAFTKYGEILGLKIGRDGRGLSRGFGFITFKDKESADRAVAEANKSFWHGRRISVEHKKENVKKEWNRTETREPTSSLFIGNIPYETSDADLNRLFRELDNVTDVRVAVDRNTGWPRGFAHADFADVESAVKAFEKLSHVELGGRVLRLDYAERGGSNKNKQSQSQF